MVYPQFNNKHQQKALFNAHTFVAWKKTKKKIGVRFPPKWIIIFDRKLLARFKRKHSKAKKINIASAMETYVLPHMGIVRMTGIGSPHAVTVFEELIALGGKEFIVIGTAGGLDQYGIFLCTKAVRDEGTSFHYIPHGLFAYPDEKLTKKLANGLTRANMPFENGPTWTIDAPYRETIAELHHYSKMGVKTVEMEASALFTVAKLRKVKIAAAFAVSDVLQEEKWDPQFDQKYLKNNLDSLLNAAIQLFSQ